VSHPHSPEHEQLVLSVVAGDRSRNDQEIRALRAQCPECEEELTQLAQIADALDAAGQEERDLIALAEVEDDAVEAAAAARFRAHPEFRGAPAPSSSRRFARRAAAWSAAAAVLLIGILVFRALRSSSPPTEPTADPGVLLGGPDERLRIEPIGTFGPDLTLRFDVDPDLAAAAAEYELVVEGSDPDGTRPYFQTFRLRATTWTDPEQVRGFPDSIQVTVRALSASGVELARSEPVAGSRAR
jgi:hypothetical protein